MRERREKFWGLCRDPSCDYCWGGLIHNHMLFIDPDLRTLTGRIVKAAMFLGHEPDGAHVYVTQPYRKGIPFSSWEGEFLVTEGDCSPRAAERRALELTAP